MVFAPSTSTHSCAQFAAVFSNRPDLENKYQPVPLSSEPSKCVRSAGKQRNVAFYFVQKPLTLCPNNQPLLFFKFLNPSPYSFSLSFQSVWSLQHSHFPQNDVLFAEFAIPFYLALIIPFKHRPGSNLLREATLLDAHSPANNFSLFPTPNYLKSSEVQVVLVQVVAPLHIAKNSQLPNW